MRWIVQTDNIQELAKEEIVKYIEPASPPLKAFNDGSRAASWVDSVQAEYNGTNFVAGEWDSGWAEANHSGLAGRVIIGDNATCNASAGDSGTCGTTSHATHVAGTIMGNGSNATTIQYRGMAPKARLVTFEWPDTLTELLNETNNSIRLYGAVVSQNSWGYDIVTAGCSTLGDYDSFSQAYDNITRGIGLAGRISAVFSAGNERNKAYCNQSTVQYSTIPPPGQTAKNSITVGAINSNDESMTAFSSFGPVDDGRLKPEVVAAGCETSGAITSSSGGNSYASACGTSQAAPAVSGILLLLHEAYNTTHNKSLHLPSSLRALLAHTAKDLNSSGPDYSTGYGLVNASEALRLIKDDTGTSRLIAYDNLSMQGDSAIYNINVPPNAGLLKVTAAWDDWPASLLAGRQLVNDLDLVVENSTGARFYPWVLNSSAPSNPAQRDRKDETNNLEQVLVEAPGSGLWTIRVNATVLPYPQSFTVISSLSLFNLPNVSLNYPNNGSVLTNSGMSFNCSASSGNGLKNITMYTNQTGLWQPYASSNITGQANSSAWAVSGLNETAYIWSCIAFDIRNNSAFAAANSSFVADFVPRWSMNMSSIPSLYSPLLLSSFNITWNDTFGVSGSLLESNFSGIRANYTMSRNGSNYSFSASMPAGTFYWRSYANDTRGNFNSSDSWIFDVQIFVSNISLLLNSSDSNFTIDEDTEANITARLNHAAAADVFSNGIQSIQNTTNFTVLQLFSRPGAYNLTVIYNGSQNYSSAAATHWLIVRDVTNPLIQDSAVFPAFGSAGDGTNVSANITDNSNISVAWLNISNSTWSNTALLQYNGTHYIKAYNISGLNLGGYNISIFANDTANNTANVSAGSFSVREKVQANVAVYNSSALLPATIRILFADTYLPKASAENVSHANFSIASGVWDLFLSSSFNTTLKGMNISSATAGNLTIEDSITASSLPSSVTAFIKIVAIQTSLNFTSALIAIPYNDGLFISESRLAAYACHEWSNNSCTGIWVLANWTSNTTANIVTVNTTHFSAFSVAERFSCGDSICDSSYGESCSACSSDCGSCPPASASGASGSGGGGARKGRMNVTSIEVIYQGVLQGKGGVNFSITVRNNGTENISYLYIETECAQGCRVGHEKLIDGMDVNRTEVIDFTFFFPDAGIYYPKIYLRYGNNSVEINLTVTNLCGKDIRRCSGDRVEICNDFSWKNAETCPNGCLEGECKKLEACKGFEKHCEDNILRECLADRTGWQKTECKHGCSDGACIAELRLENRPQMVTAIIVISAAFAILVLMARRRLSIKKHND